MSTPARPPEGSAATILLQVEDLQTAYGASQVLFGINLQIRAGEVATLLGRNGMGKSTTVRSIMGMTPARGGRIRFRDQAIEARSSDAIARMGMALVPEGRQIFPNLTVRENLVAFAENRNGTPEPWTLERVFGFFPGLAERSNNMGNQLSGGEQQMLAIARALARDIKVLLLDEPYEGLAPVIVQEIAKTLGLIREQGITTVIVEQNAVAALKLADRAVILDTGSVVFDGTAQEVLENAQLRAQYLAI